MSGLARRLASALAASASRLLPRAASGWSGAMERELAEIPDDPSALRFAAGCLRAAAGLAIAAWLSAAARALAFPFLPSSWSFPAMTRLADRPRLLGLACGAAAVALGLAYMVAAGAPSRYLLVNLGALVLGASAWLALGRWSTSSLPAAGPAVVALAVPLLLTALFGVAVEGASRWVSVGPLSVQVSLIVVPVMLVLYSRRPDAVGTAGILVAALALALQPDRAMAGALLAGLLALAAATRRGLALLAVAASALAFGWTWLAPDRLTAAAFVDRILYSAFDVHPLAGLAVLLGAAAMLVPAAAALSKRPGDRAALLAFAACWSAAIAAAALGNYPTPLVGYGGSAVLGYLLSVSLLPGRPGEAARRGASATAEAGAAGAERPMSELRAAPLG
ncbi:MAG TPA: hypothetical protein VF759_12500 [Allosphingosinicella sp.]